MEKDDAILRLGATGESARVICVLVHGRGQTPEEMEDAIIRHLPGGDVVWLLPRAPGKAWYAARAIDPLTDATRAELAASLGLLAACVAQAQAENPGLPLVLAGFSQGACLSLEYACGGHRAPDAFVAFTGCRVGQAGDTRPSAALNRVPVYLTGADADPWIPVFAVAEAAANLGLAGARLRLDLFPGRPHEVSAPERVMLGTILSDLAAGRAVTWGAAA
jgi:phospholipase/carboxylesterase